MPTGGKMDPPLPSLIKAPVKKDINGFVKQFIDKFGNTPTSIPSANTTPSQQLYALQAQADDLFSSKPSVLYKKDDPITLTTGKMRGATPSKRLIRDIATAADAEGVDRNTLLGLAAQESMFGSGYAAGRREVPTGSSAKSVVSGWNLDAPYRPTDLKQFLKSKGVPGIQLVKTKTGYLYTNAPNVSDEQLNHSIDSMAQIHPELIDQYAQSNSNVIPAADVNYFREAAKFIKTQGLSKYNPGDPDYPNKVNNSANLVRQDPNLQSYIRSFAKGGTMNFSSKANYKKWLAYGHIHGNFEATPGNQKISINGNNHKVRHAADGDTIRPINRSVRNRSKIPNSISPLSPNSLNNPDFLGRMAHNSDQDAMNWIINYMQSPKYKERLSNFYKNPDNISKQRINRVNDINIFEVNDPLGTTGSQYTPGSNELYMDNNQTRNIPGGRRDDILIHELSHATNNNISNSNFRLTPEEEEYMFDKEKLYGTKNVPDGKESLGKLYKEIARKKKMPLSNLLMTLDETFHDASPSEIKSDIDSFRYLLKKQGIYDASTQDMNQEILDKARKNIGLYNTFEFQRLQKNYDDKDLIDVMNKVASAPTKRNEVYAKFGGKINNNRKAAYGDSLQPIYYNNPYSVNNRLQNPIPFQPYNYSIPNSEPLRQGLQNVTNYFANNPNNIVPNSASAQGPSFYQTENLLNADTDQVSQSKYQPLDNPIGDVGQAAPNKVSSSGKFSMPNLHFNTAAPIMAVAGLINATAEQDRINEEYARQARRNSMIEGYNPFPYGTGSQAIYKNGGELSAEKAKKMLKENKANGKKLTKKQKGYFGFIAGGGHAKANDGMNINPISQNGFVIGQTYDLHPSQISQLQNMGYELDFE